MSKTKLTYLGPLGGATTEATRRKVSWRKLPWPFLMVVVIPTVLAAIYFLLLASPRYVSEARFVVRSQSHQAPTSLGAALQGVGLSAATTDAFAVHEYAKSRVAVRDLEQRVPLRRMLGRHGTDPLFPYPRLGESQSAEALYRAFQRFITVGYDSTNGISTLRVEAFTPSDAQRIANELLNGGERLVNDMNDRAAQQAVSDSERRVREAEVRLAEVQTQLTNFRNNQGLLDPAQTAAAGSQLIATLMTQLAEMRAERAQLMQSTPESPALPILENRIRAFEQQIEAERARMTGDATSLAPQISAYQRLELDLELAGRELTVARTARNEALLESRRQKLYLERIVSPNLADEATEPKRLLSVFVTLLTALLLYGMGWLIWSGVREHRQ